MIFPVLKIKQLIDINSVIIWPITSDHRSFQNELIGARATSNNRIQYSIYDWTRVALIMRVALAFIYTLINLSM